MLLIAHIGRPWFVAFALGLLAGGFHHPRFGLAALAKRAAQAAFTRFKQGEGVMFMVFHSAPERRPYLIALFGFLLVVGGVLAFTTL